MVEDSLASTPVAERLAVELFYDGDGEDNVNSTITPRGGAIFERY